MFTNTLTQQKEPFSPISDPVKIYVCGMTVQDQPHMGHMRAYITSDLVKRYLEFSGYKTLLIQNFTDIDDKIIIRAKEENKDYRIIAEQFIQEYLEVADGLNIERADIFPRATQHIQEIIELVKVLVDKGLAYRANGDVYYDVTKFVDYGKLSKKRLDGLIAGARISPGEKKRGPMDFALWKASKDGEPWWESPWGKGRPGWHTECSAMSMHYLGETFDIHMGGEDLIFPHHENEIAQSEGATGKPFVNYWLHNAMLNLTGEKMAKSTRHYYAAKEILAKYSANSIRLYFLQAHYRSQIEFNFERLDAAESAFTRIEDFLRQAEAKIGKIEVSADNIDTTEFRAAMDDDLNTSKVIGMIFDLTTKGFAQLEANDLDNLKTTSALVTLYLQTLGFQQPKRKVIERSFEATLSLKPEAEFFTIEKEFKDARDLARKLKEFDIADIIRKGFAEFGLELKDTSEGSQFVPLPTSQQVISEGRMLGQMMLAKKLAKEKGLTEIEKLISNGLEKTLAKMASVPKEIYSQIFSE
ncbi:MAG: cysteine--tRNA ligase [candidate division WOR-3 bacterium]|nr:cysteine--tRNA ligase [candidate division WOR-3 bacterium]